MFGILYFGKIINFKINNFIEICKTVQNFDDIS